MSALLWWCIGGMGAVQILTEGTIFQPVRAWIAQRSAWLGILVSCPMCLGLWVGVVLGLVYGVPAQQALIVSPGVGSRLLGALFAGMALSWLAYAWTTLRGFLSRPRPVGEAYVHLPEPARERARPAQDELAWLLNQPPPGVPRTVAEAPTFLTPAAWRQANRKTPGGCGGCGGEKSA